MPRRFIYEFCSTRDTLHTCHFERKHALLVACLTRLRADMLWDVSERTPAPRAVSGENGGAWPNRRFSSKKL